MSEAIGPCPSSEALDAFASPEWKVGGDAREAEIGVHVGQCKACAEWVRNAKFEREFAAAASARAFSRDLTEPSLPELPGYEIVREVSRGGQGIVFEAVQIRTRRRVALKILRQDHGVRRSQRARFEREIEIAAALHHPGIVGVYDSIALPRGRHALVLEFVEGRSLDQLMAECARDQAHMDQCVEMLGKVCEAIHYAHQRGVIHRDLKPSNILVDAVGNPRILDFGVACWFGASAGEPTRITLTGEFAGTLAYAAPEQVSGDRGAPDLRSDLYAIGVMLYQASVGELPYDVRGSLDTVIRNIAAAAPIRPVRGKLDEDLWIIISKALAKEPDRRYQSGDAMASDLRRYLRGETIEARRDSRLYVLRKLLVRHRYSAAGVVAAIAGLAVFGATLKWNNTKLIAALRTSTIERARALGAAGSRSEADALLWPEILRFGPALDRPVHSLFNGTTEERRALWAGVELQAFQPCLAITRLSDANLPAARSTDIVWSDDEVGVASNDGTLRFWSLPDLRPVRERQLFKDRVLDLKIARSKRVGIARTEYDVRLFDVESGDVLGKMDCEGGLGLHMTLSQSGATLAIWNSGSGAEFFSLPDFRRLFAAGGDLAMHTPWISPEDDRVAVVTEGGRARVYGLPDGKLLADRQVVPSEFVANDLHAIDDPWNLTVSGDLLAVGRRRRVSFAHASNMAAPPPLLATVGNFVEPVFTSSGRWMLTRSNQDSRIHIWQTSDWTEFTSLPGHTGGPVVMSVSPDEKFVLSVDNDRVMRLWAGPVAGWKQDLPESALSPHDLALDPKTGEILAACTTGIVGKWSLDVAVGPILTRVDPKNAYTIAYSPALGVRAVAGEMGKVVLTGEGELPILEVAGGAPITNVRFSPDGKYLAVASKYGPVVIYSTSSWKPVHTFEMMIGRLATVRWNAGGTRVAVSGAKGMCEVLAVPDFRSEARWKAHVGPCRAADFSGDGLTLATGGDDGIVRLWETSTWTLKGEIPIGKDNIFCLAFHPDGNVLAVGDRAGRITQVDIPGAKALASFTASSPVMAIEFVGPRLIVGTIDRPIAVLDFGMLACCVQGDASYWSGQIHRVTPP